MDTRTLGKRIVIGTGILAAFSVWASAAPKPIAQPSPAFLARVYAGLNTAYWQGRLPTSTIVSFGASGREDAMAYTTRDRAGVFHITLDWECNKLPNVARLTLFHEMSHIATWDREFNPHGKYWRAEMHRLADAGAFDEIW